VKRLEKWQEPIYAIGSLGPGCLYQVMILYLLYFYRPAQERVAAGAVIFAPAAGYAAGMLIARALNGVVEIPIATWTDNMRSRLGRRRPLMLIGFVPLVITFILSWYPPLTGGSLGPDGHWGNALYVTVMNSLFLFFYTMIIVPYVAALSELVPDENARVRVASWQTFFGTAGLVIAFVVAPILFDRFGVQATALLLLPSMLSFIGPFLVIKEAPSDRPTQDGSTAGQAASSDVLLWQSVKMTLGNQTFRIYIASMAIYFFGQQFFLGGIAFIAADMMGLTDSQLGIMNAAVFAPVPVMLILFNLLNRRKGAKWSFRLALLIYAGVMSLYPLAWTRLGLPVPPLVLGIFLSAISSFSVGVFSTIPYAFPAQIAAIEAAETGKDRAGMYFAVQGLVNHLVGGLASSVLALLLTWEYGVVAVAPIAGLACVVAFFLFAPYPLGKPSA
jgi:GPH family glycoside/pentoside/hexuronide:cation symporter